MLIDTHVLIWFTMGETISDAGRAAIIDAVDAGQAVVSAVTAWEIGALASRRRVAIPADARNWFRQATVLQGIAVAPLDANMAIEATLLPGELHRDPADRFLIATARRLHIPIATRDRAILDYAAAGHVRAVAC